MGFKDIFRDISNKPKRKNKGQFTKAKWADPAFRKKMVAARRNPTSKVEEFPNSAERKLQSILDSMYPNDWEYTGDHRFWLGNRNPDFRHKHRKLLVELFGESWHPRSDESHRKNHYNQHGYNCLVIWSKELYRQHPRLVKAKIRKFVNQQPEEDWADKFVKKFSRLSISKK